MKNETFLYKSIFLYASLQFCGNTEEYFARHTEKLLVFILMPRIKNKNHLVRIYNKGKLIQEKKIQLPESIYLHYPFWYITYLKLIATYFSKKDNVVVIGSHPLIFFGMTLQKMLVNVRFVFWIEYFPRANLVLSLFDDLKNFYHKRVDFACYFGDRVNKLMNGEILNTEKRKTILWGVKPQIIKKMFPSGKRTILFVGLIKESQGLDLVFQYLRIHKNYYLKIIGVCDDTLYAKYQKMFVEYGIVDQIDFANKFFSEKELQNISKECFVGIAPYATGKGNGVYYVDPGKIKAYAELGLPIIMSNTSSILPYVKKFKAGEVIQRNVVSLHHAIEKIQHDYKKYLEGLKKFNKYFYFENYYAKNFKFLENF